MGEELIKKLDAHSVSIQWATDAYPYGSKWASDAHSQWASDISAKSTNKIGRKKFVAVLKTTHFINESGGKMLEIPTLWVYLQIDAVKTVLYVEYEREAKTVSSEVSHGHSN